MSESSPLRRFLEKHWQTGLNIYLFLSFGIWCIWHTYQIHIQGNLTLLELSFIIPNFILVALFLLRKPHKAICLRPADQFISLFAFCSGMPIIGSRLTGGTATVMISGVVIILSNLLAIACLLNLGKSFGILIAFRELKDNGLYGIIRHPMYLSDILLRVGYVISHLDPFTITVVLLGTAAYVYRAMLEERFLSEQTEYAAYMKRVPYRFIPAIF